MKKAATLALLAILTSGCATQTYLVSSQTAPTAATEAEVDEMQTFFLSGIGQSQQIDAAQACNGKQNVASIQTEENPVDVVLRVVTFGIYTPRQVRVYCQ